MKKILIIGPAPPKVEQKFPYDTTLLYWMFSLVQIDLYKSKDKFDFEALVKEFPGTNSSGGHKIPKKKEIQEYYDKVLKKKIEQADKVILLGSPAKNFIYPSFDDYGIEGKFLFIPHPSRRNYNRIMKMKDLLTEYLFKFLKC